MSILPVLAPAGVIVPALTGGLLFLSAPRSPPDAELRLELKELGPWLSGPP